MNYESKPFQKKPIETRRDSSKVKSDTIPAPNIPNFLRVTTAAPVDNTLEKIIEDRNKPDPDFFRGLGQFLTKKFQPRIPMTMTILLYSLAIWSPRFQKWGWDSNCY